MDGGRTPHHDVERHRFIDLTRCQKSKKNPATAGFFHTAAYNLEVVGKLCTIVPWCIDITYYKQLRTGITPAEDDRCFRTLVS
jgi:hypothetical protein